MTAITFRKKPVTVEAIQWTGDNAAEIRAFLGKAMPYPKPDADNVIWVSTLEGMIGYGVGYWLIKGVQGEHYGCKAEVFAQTYEQATGDEAERITINGKPYDVVEWDWRDSDDDTETWTLYATPAEQSGEAS